MKTLIQNVRLLSVCAVLCGMTVGANLSANFQQATTQQAQPLQGKQLTSSEINLLNAALERQPVAIARMKMAYDEASKISKELESITSNDPKIFAAQICKILKPVKEFFNIIHDYAHIVIPLVEESLLTTELRSASQAEKNDLSLILKFFNSKADIETFFSAHMKTKQDLQNACVEFMTFFNDLYSSLTEKTLLPYKKMLEEIRAKKKLPAQNNSSSSKK